MNEKQMNELIKAEQREYHRRWREANRDKIKEHNANYWRKRVEKKLKEKSNQGVAS